MLILLTVPVIFAWYLLDHLYAPKLLVNEPSLISQSIPYVGHILGLIRHGTKYYEMTSLKCKLPIYTLNMLNGKVYVVTSPDLVGAVYRNAKTLAFNPFIAKFSQRITNYDEATSLIVQHNLNGENGPGYVIESHDAILKALAPGENLEKMTLIMLEEVSDALIAFDHHGDNDKINFFAWIRKTVTMCSTKAIYGSENPFSKYPELEKAFWEYERDLNLFMLDVAPSILARKGYNARMKIGDAFTQYFEDYISKRIQSSAMIFSRYTANIRYDVSFGNQGRLEVGALIGILSNTIPSLFYMLVHIYADHELLHNIREELENTAMLTCDNSKKILILSMRKKCHLLRSTFQEVLRFHAKGVGSRYVREDTILDGQYFLKKGMVVQIPMAVMHLDPTIWGPDAEEFKPDRFLGKSDGQNKPKPDDEVRLGENGEKNSKHIPTGYRPFGGGASLCPGRHWVTLEALALTAIMVLRFDIRPINREWNIPSQNQMNLAVDVFPPAYDIKVAIKKRKGMEDTNWEYLME